jgi:hypothetical protein
MSAASLFEAERGELGLGEAGAAGGPPSASHARPGAMWMLFLAVAPEGGEAYPRPHRVVTSLPAHRILGPMRPEFRRRRLVLDALAEAVLDRAVARFLTPANHLRLQQPRSERLRGARSSRRRALRPEKREASVCDTRAERLLVVVVHECPA